MSTVDARVSDFEEMYGTVHPGRRMTEEEFDAWIWVGEKTRAEWVDGEVVMMAPASVGHDDLVGWVRSVLAIYVRAKELGSVHGPEVLVRLASIRRKRLPDVMFVSKVRRGVVKETQIDGAPDLIVEVVSPDSAERDWVRKYEDYERAGVREHWIIDPQERRMEAYRLGAAGKGYRAVKAKGRRVTSSVVSGFYLRHAWLFGGELPSVLRVVRELGVGD